MTTPTIDALALHAARLSRRRSLLTLGGAAMALATTAAVEPGYARNNNKNKNNNKHKKKGRKGKGPKAPDCQEQEQQRCANDAAACKATLQPLCNQDNVAECLAIQTCCEQCSAGGFLTCLLGTNQV
jgi:hypothetical protein